MGGPGSGSKPGTKASNYKDGRWIYRERSRAKLGAEARRRGVSPQTLVRHHRRPCKRDCHTNAKEGDHSPSNMKIMSRKEHGRLERRKQLRRR